MPQRMFLGGLLGNETIQLVQTSRNPLFIMSSLSTPLSRLEELKARKFTAADRPARVAKSLAVLQQPGTIQLNQEDWRWLDENSSIEDEFE